MGARDFVGDVINGAPIQHTAVVSSWRQRLEPVREFGDTLLMIGLFLLAVPSMLRQGLTNRREGVFGPRMNRP